MSRKKLAKKIELDVINWSKTVLEPINKHIGFPACPFAAKWRKDDKVRIEVRMDKSKYEKQLTDVIKFVIETKEDYEWSKNIIFNNSLTNHPNIYFSPVHDKLEPSLIASWILEDSLNVTLQLQIHKYIWGDVRGR